MEPHDNILETYLMPNGLEIDLDEGFTKLTERQFGGNPGRAFSELIQNAIDSYPSGTPWEERMGEIWTGPKWISITDYGEGMNTFRLKLLVTLGGTDKFNNADKIGQFGMGFMSMFNRKLGTRQIIVKTRCESETVQLVFNVKEPGKRPEISTCILDEKIPYGTMIKAEFESSNRVSDCLSHAQKSLSYYPCPIKINGELHRSCWESNGKGDTILFSENGCRGLIRKISRWDNIRVLCKYELVMESSLDHFLTGGNNARYNLEDFQTHGAPFIPDTDIMLNADKLNVTISRDSFYLDWAYQEAKGILIRHLKTFLLREIDKGVSAELIMANQYIFRREIESFLTDPFSFINKQSDDNRLIEVLATLPVYRICGRPGIFSLKALKEMKRADLPFYFSPERTNLRWLGGSFRHDYIVIPDACRINGGATQLFDNLFSTVFGDIVNLDTIQGNQKKIVELVERDIISKESLSPKTKIIGIRNLTSGEQGLLKEIDVLLGDPAIINVIETNLHMKVSCIESVFFEMEEGGWRISSGLFDANGKALNEKYISNFLKQDGEEEKRKKESSGKSKVLLGLNLKHPFIQYLLTEKDSHRNFYGLTYLAHELALCQKMLVPYSPFYHLVKQRLAQDMRKALIRNLLARINN